MVWQGRGTVRSTCDGEPDCEWGGHGDEFVEHSDSCWGHGV